MSSFTPEPTLPPASAPEQAPTLAISKGLKITTIVFAALAGLGLVVTLILLFVTLAQRDTDEFGWYFAFAVIASILNVIPAVVALVLGIVGRGTKGRVSRIGVIIGIVVLVVLVAQLIFLSAV